MSVGSPLHHVMLLRLPKFQCLSPILFEGSWSVASKRFRRGLLLLPRHLNTQEEVRGLIDYQLKNKQLSSIESICQNPDYRIDRAVGQTKVRRRRPKLEGTNLEKDRESIYHINLEKCTLPCISYHPLSRSLQINKSHSSKRCFSVSSRYQNKDDVSSKKPDSQINQNSHDHSHKHSHGHEGGGSALGSVFHHSHSHASTPETHELLLGDKKDPKVAITRLGLMVNIGMVLTKGIGGLVFHSASLTADAIHAVSDLISDFVTLGTVSWSSRKPSLQFPYGYGKLETLGSLVVSGLLLTGGLSIGWDGLQVLYTLGYEYYFHHSHEAASYVAQEIANRTTDGAMAASTTVTPPTAVGGHSHHHHHLGEEIPSLNAAYLALVSIIVKEYLFRATRKVAESTRSTVLMANAWHHRTDSLTAMVAVVAITGGHFWQATWLDPLGGVLVSLLIIRAACSSGYNTLLELMDASQPEVSEHAREATTSAINQLANLIDTKQAISDPILNTRLEVLSHLLVKDAIAIKSGPNYNISVTLLLKDMNNNVESEKKETDLDHNNENSPSTYDAIEIAAKVCRNIEHQVEQSMPGAKNVEVRILNTKP